MSLLSDLQVTQIHTMMRPYKGPKHTVVSSVSLDGASEVFGTGAKPDALSFDDMIFEIGSITKVFTSILMCLLAEEGRIDPNATVREISPELDVVPEWITPAQLASHTSRLPRIHIPIWKALIKPLPKDPYSEFTRDDLLDWFRDWRAEAPPKKTHHSYSNLGVGLLGEALSIREGKPFVDLLTERVLAPLGLIDTVVVLNEDQQHRFMQPRSTKGKAVPAWTFQSMAAAGCLRSTVKDLGLFSERVIQASEAPQTALDRAICRSLEPIFGLSPGGGTEPAAQCAGWMSMTLEKSGPRILHHDGGTAGSTCALYVCPEKAASIVVLSNNGVAANLWASAKLSWSNPLRQAHQIFADL